MNPLIALTGGIACGKTLAQKYLKEAGLNACIDTDAVCHELYRHLPFAAAQKLRGAWGQEIVSDEGKVDRSLLAQKIFGADGTGTAEALDLLHEVIHPEIMRETDRLVRNYAESGHAGPILVVVPLLFEYGMQVNYRSVISVWCDSETQLKRLMSRGNFPREEAERRIAAQMSADRKLELADYGLINNGTPEGLRIQCVELARRLNELK